MLLVSSLLLLSATFVRAELTFIVFDASEAKITDSIEDPSTSESDASAAALKRSEAEMAGMCGDVNIFMLDPDHCDDYVAVSGATDASLSPQLPGEEAAASSTVAASLLPAVSAPSEATAASSRAPVTAEIMVMMADPAYRRRGLAVEAVLTMMRYGASAMARRVAALTFP